MTENDPQPPAEGDAQAQPSFMLRGQFVKDLSLENPHAPESLLSMRQAPKVDLNIDLEARHLQNELFELSMRFSIAASAAEQTLFLIDLTYGGLFALADIPEDRIEGALMVDGALMLFPFARRVVADLTRDAGYPPLMLEPVDFYRLYVDRIGQMQNEAQAVQPPVN